MLVCKKCGDNHVYGIIPNALQLEVELDKVGDITERLLREAGMWDSDSRSHNIHRMVVSELIKYGDLTDDLIKEFVCRGCNTKGPMKSFESTNFCRCGTRTDNVYICEKHRFILCAHCIDSYMCAECAIFTCLLNPENKKTKGFREVMGEEYTQRRSRGRYSSEPPTFEPNFDGDDPDFEDEEDDEEPLPLPEEVEMQNGRETLRSRQRRQRMQSGWPTAQTISTDTEATIGVSSTPEFVTMNYGETSPSAADRTLRIERANRAARDQIRQNQEENLMRNGATSE